MAHTGAPASSTNAATGAQVCARHSMGESAGMGLSGGAGSDGSRASMAHTGASGASLEGVDARGSAPEPPVALLDPAAAATVPPL